MILEKVQKARDQENVEAHGHVLAQDHVVCKCRSDTDPVHPLEHSMRVV